MKTEALVKLIGEITAPIETATVEYFWNAMTDYREFRSTLDAKMKEEVAKIEGRSNQIWATPTIRKNLIEGFGKGKYMICEKFNYDFIKGNQEPLKAFIAKDFDGKRAKLLYKIEKEAKGREVVELSSVDHSNGGDLSAWVKLEDGTILDIYTIYAGGYNVQQLHFRQLVKVRKGK